jgi:hypothetical protein
VRKLLAAAAITLAVIGCRRGAEEFKVFKSSDGRYSCELPVSWRLIEEPAGSSYPGFIAEPTGKEYDYEPLPSLAASFNAASSGAASMRDYVEALAKAGGSRQIEAEIPVFEARDGISMASLTRTLRQPASMVRPGPAVQMKEAYVILEAAGGYYVLRYSSRLADFDRHSAAFERMSASFRAR